VVGPAAKISVAAVGALTLLSSCRGCPEIGCGSQIDIALRAPIATPYTLVVQVAGDSATIECPHRLSEPFDRTTLKVDCTSSQFTVYLRTGAAAAAITSVDVTISSGTTKTSMTLATKLEGSFGGTEACESPCRRYSALF
jgi:hypothetical protein